MWLPWTSRQAIRWLPLTLGVSAARGLPSPRWLWVETSWSFGSADLMSGSPLRVRGDHQMASLGLQKMCGFQGTMLTGKRGRQAEWERSMLALRRGDLRSSFTRLRSSVYSLHLGGRAVGTRTRNAPHSKRLLYPLSYRPSLLQRRLGLQP